MRQEIMEALITLLSGITVENGYSTDIGLNVMSEFDALIDSLPAVNILEEDADVPQNIGPEWQHDLPVKITVVSNGTASYMRSCVSDVLKAIKSDKTLGNRCVDIIPGPNSIKEAEEGEHFSEASVSVTLQYLTEEWEL